MKKSPFAKFSFHVSDRPELQIGAHKLPEDVRSLLPESPEQIARGYLREAFEAEELEGFRQPDLPHSSRLEFELKNQKVQPLTRNRVLKFDQKINDIPVYGAEVEVELDEQNDLVSILSALSDVENCDPEPKISEEEAIRIAVNYLEREDFSGEEDPALYFYPMLQEGGEKLTWKLVYFFL
jgi:Zn-dependent metalloprotease